MKISKDDALLLTTAVAITAFITWLTTMKYYDGQCDMNKYGEGYPETALFGIISIIGLYALFKR